LAIAMMRLIVDHDDILEREQLTAGAVEHLPVGLSRFERLGRIPGQESPAHPRQLHSLAVLEGVVIGDDDGRLADVAKHVVGQQLAGAVIAPGMLRVEHLEPVADRDAGSDDQECPREAVGAGSAYGIERLPGDNHCHNGSLAGAGRHFQGDAEQLQVGVGICCLDRAPQIGILPFAAGDLGQPDQRLDRLDLAKERPLAGEIEMAPMLKQALSGRGHPRIDPAT
jgi:hypothetical protein